MNNKWSIFFGAIFVVLSGVLSIYPGITTVYAPLSIVVILPALFVRSLGLPIFFLCLLSTVPITAFYLGWSLFFIKAPFTISKGTVVFTIALIIYSISYNMNSYDYGIRYQGRTHTLLMYGYNLFFIAVLMIIFIRNRIQPRFNSCLGFNIVLFSWLAWVAFPWLGELAV